MTICNTCLLTATKHDELPELPIHNIAHSPWWRYFHDFCYDAHEGVSAGHETVQFHESIHALQSSAQHCNLCHLMANAVSKVEKELSDLSEGGAGWSKYVPFSRPTWRLWVTKRVLGDGFYVFSFCESVEEFLLVAAVGICVKEGDLLGSLFNGRVLSESPDDPAPMSQIMRWVQLCNEHVNCAIGNMPVLPSRVIDVGNETNDYHIRLHESGHEERGNYICLSHCWGSVTQFTTTKATLHLRKANIDPDELPKTYQDAIVITKHLGVRYLWIDSLCICQDDKDEWWRESKMMASIYMQSYLTIAAAAAENGSIGCFAPRNIPKYVSIPYTSRQGISGELQCFLLPVRKESVVNLYLDMADSLTKTDHRLSTRAWALQERVLPRRTLHYGMHQMYFECNEGFKGENGLRIPRRYAELWQGEGHKNIDEPWNQIVWNYSSRDLTYPADKLPAISGVARILAERFKDQYAAGLWRSSLVPGLLWNVLGGYRVAEYRAPSWSWISVDGIVGIPSTEWVTTLAKIFDVEVKTHTSDEFGEIYDGSIKIQAPLLSLIYLSSTLEGSPSERVNAAGFKAKRSDLQISVIRTHLDVPRPWDLGDHEHALSMLKILETRKLYALIIATDSAEDHVLKALLVWSYDDKLRRVQRLGTIDCSLSGGDDFSISKTDDWPIVTIV